MKHQQTGFTLTELLVVITIIVILFALLLPSLNYAIDRAQDLKCMNNVKQLTLGILAFSADHGGFLPGNCLDGQSGGTCESGGATVDTGVSSIPDRRDWAGNTWTGGGKFSGCFVCSPITTVTNGTVYSYVGNPKIYRCPSLPDGRGLGAGYSNGVIDYQIPAVLTGCKVDYIASEQVRTSAASPGFGLNGQGMPIWILCEADPVYSNNSTLNGAGGAYLYNLSGYNGYSACNTLSRMSNTHNNGCYLGTLQGGVYFYQETAYTKSSDNNYYVWSRQGSYTSGKEPGFDCAQWGYLAGWSMW